MRLTHAELIFINSVSGGGNVPGISLVDTSNALTKNTEQVLDSCEKKGLIVAGALSEKALGLVRAMELYRNAASYRLLNRMGLVTLDEKIAVVLWPVNDEEIEFGPVHLAELTLLLLSDFDFLRRQDQDEIHELFRATSYMEWMDLHGSVMDEHSVLFQEYVDDKLIDGECFYERNGRVFHYVFSTGQFEALPPSKARLMIVDILKKTDLYGRDVTATTIQGGTKWMK